MRYLALTTDYDGILAEGRAVAEVTWEAVQRLGDSGRKVLRGLPSRALRAGCARNPR